MAKKKIKITQNQNMLTRPAIVTLMGHVDHGKTSILDAIRQTQITATESGGITQQIGAYSVERNGKKLVFIDTPGHEAFTQMRARGGAAADVVVLVVAADDGVMPQTKEAILHAKAAAVPIVVAINKIDLPGANITKVKQQLSQNGILVEGYGGDIVVAEVSAIKGTGIDNLLDVLNLVAELEQDKLKVDINGLLRAIIIESRHDPKRGIEVSAIVKEGTLKVRDDVIAGKIETRIKSIIDSYGKSLKEAVPGDAVKLLGFSETPAVGEIIHRKGEAFESTKKEETETDSKSVLVEGVSKKKALNLIIRADTVGTQEAIVASINKLQVEDAQPVILFAGTGDVKESDVLLASTARGVVIAFKVNVSSAVADIADSQKVIIREHDIIYKLLEEIEAALEGVLEIEEAKIKGRGLVIKIFTLPKSGMKIAGTLIEAGKFKVNDRIGIFRAEDEVPLYVARVKELHIGTDEVDVAKKGSEAGLLFKPALDDVQLDDRIEAL